MCLSCSQSHPHVRRLAERAKTTRSWESRAVAPTPRALIRNWEIAAFWLGLEPILTLPSGGAFGAQADDDGDAGAARCDGARYRSAQCQEGRLASRTCRCGRVAVARR